MTHPVTTALLDRVARQVADLQAQIDQLKAGNRAPQLQNASITNTAITVYDADGETPLQYIGAQGDGTAAVVNVNGPTPPAPSAPTVEAAPLGLTVSWDGMDADGDAQPADFDHAAVHLSTTDGFTPDPTTLRGTLSRAGSISLTPLTTDPHYVVLVAVSTSGVQSDPSAQTAGTPLPAADIRPGSITETEIADDSISTPKLRAEAVTADKIAANTITTGQIAAGAITAETLSADAIDGKVITGAIVQTATEGNRVTLDGPDGVLVFYSGDAAETSPATAAAFAGDFGDGTSLASLQLFAPTLNGNAGNVLIELFSIGGGDRINLQAPEVDVNGVPAMYTDFWTDLTLTSPYRAHNTVSGGFGYTPQYRFIGPNTVQLRGVVSRSSGTIATGDVVAALPAAIRPAQQHCGLVACGTAVGSMWSVRMDVRGPGAATSPNSLVLLFTAGYAGSGTGAAPGWVSLDGIVYDIA